MNILFVCTANTCRSPIAHGIFENMLKSKKGKHTVKSAGIYARPSDTITENAQRQLHKRKIDFANRHSVQITNSLVTEADLIFTMTNNQRRLLVQSYPYAADKIHLLGDYTNRKDDVEDPYGQNMHAYSKCASKIEDMLNILYTMI